MYEHIKQNTHIREPGWGSQYSDWLRAGRLKSQCSSPGRVKNFLFSTSSIPALGAHPASYSMGIGGKAAEA
jgi:hypothetical protein